MRMKCTTEGPRAFDRRGPGSDRLNRLNRRASVPQFLLKYYF